MGAGVASGVDRGLPLLGEADLDAERGAHLGLQAIELRVHELPIKARAALRPGDDAAADAFLQVLGGLRGEDLRELLGAPELDDARGGHEAIELGEAIGRVPPAHRLLADRG